MVPLILMVVGCIAFRLAGIAGLLHAADSWPGALRLALALMFAFTGVAHFLPRGRREMLPMVPPELPVPICS